MRLCCPYKWHKFFNAVCDKRRQEILGLVKQHKIINANEIVKSVKLSQPTVSHHLKILNEAGLIFAEKKGKEIFYSINNKNIEKCCVGFMEKFSRE